MKIFIILLIMSLPVHADYNYVELSQGVKLKNLPWKESNWNGDYPTSISLGRHWDYSKTVYIRIEFEHISNILRGAPFNDKYETWLDQAKVTIGLKF